MFRLRLEFQKSRCASIIIADNCLLVKTVKSKSISVAHLPTDKCKKFQCFKIKDKEERKGHDLSGKASLSFEIV